MRCRAVGRWVLGVGLLLTVMIFPACGDSPGVPTGTEVIPFSVVRSTDAAGNEKVALSMGTVYAPKQGILFTTSGGASRNARDALDWVRTDVSEKTNAISQHIPQKMSDHRWIAAIASNVPGRKLTLDIKGVDRVEFADGKARPWPVTFQEGAVAIDFTYTEGGKVARVNEVLQSGL